MDKSMCTNHGCIERMRCLRYTGSPGYIQSYTKFESDEYGNCEYFIYNGKICGTCKKITVHCDYRNCINYSLWDDKNE